MCVGECATPTTTKGEHQWDAFSPLWEAVNSLIVLARSAESKRCFQNFAEPNLSDWPQAYFGDNYQRFVQVKARYDPGNVFRHAQSIPSNRSA
jgi:Berberine and berberine like